MAKSERVRQFKAAAWSSPAELMAFVGDVEGLIPAELEEMLEFLVSKLSTQEVQKHKARTFALDALIKANPAPALFRPMIKLIKTAPHEQRALLGLWLPLVNSIPDHEDLCALLKNDDPGVRAIARDALNTIGGKTALNTLTAFLRERAFAGGQEAIDVIVHIAGPHAVNVLTEVLKHPDPALRITAVKYLGDTRYMANNAAAAMRALSVALGDQKDGIITAAIASIGELASEDEFFELAAPFFESKNPRLVIAAVTGLKRFSSPRVTNMLEKRLRAGPLQVRFAVLSIIEIIGGDELLPPLVTALAHRQIQIRTRASEVMSALSKAGRVDIVRTVIWMLRRPDVNLRRSAADLISSIPNADDLWPKLLGFLRTEDWWVRERVIDAVAGLAGSKLTPYMALWLEDPSAVLRRFALSVLQRLKDPQAAGLLLQVALNDTDWWVREMAIEALATVDDPRIPPHLVSLLDTQPELRIACCEALATMKAADALPKILELLAESNDPAVRVAALHFVLAVDGRLPLEQIRSLAQDTNVHVRALGRQLLVRHDVVAAGMDGEDGLSFLDRTLVAASKAGADDVFITADRRVYIKKHGEMKPFGDEVLALDKVNALLMPLLNSVQLEEIAKIVDLDFSYEVKTHGTRYRVNLFHEQPGLSAVFRVISSGAPELDKLGLPPVVQGLAELPHGLILIGGPTGSGKSTTLAALIRHINKTKGRHIISLEDPIEVPHKSDKSLVNQRELGSHTTSFSNALRSALRADPDVLLIGEMRDLATISLAVTAAETGHLVFGTVHTVSADTSIDRIINAFPGDQQDQVRSLLSDALRAVVCQFLVKRKNPEDGRAVACEILLNNDAVANIIRKGKCFQIPAVLQTSRDVGMQTMDQDLMRLWRTGTVDKMDVYMKARSKRDFDELIAGDASLAPVAGGGASATATATATATAAATLAPAAKATA